MNMCQGDAPSTDMSKAVSKCSRPPGHSKRGMGEVGSRPISHRSFGHREWATGTRWSRMGQEGRSDSGERANRMQRKRRRRVTKIMAITRGPKGDLRGAELEEEEERLGDVRCRPTRGSGVSAALVRDVVRV